MWSEPSLQRRRNMDSPVGMAALTSPKKEFSLERREASPSHVLTKIESFSKLSEHGISKLESVEFEGAGNYKWKLIFYPDGDEVGKKTDHISVYLSMVGTSSLPAGWDVTAIFNFFLYDHISDQYLCFRGIPRRFNKINHDTRFSKLVTKKTFLEPSNGFVFDDKCVFGAEVFVVEKLGPTDTVPVFDPKDLYGGGSKISDSSKHENSWRCEKPSKYGRWRSLFCMGDNARAQTTQSTNEFTYDTRHAPPSHFLGKIKSFSELSNRGISKLESKEFDATGYYKWKLVIYPNGDEVGKKSDHISVKLSMVGIQSLAASHDVMTAIFIFFIYNHNSDNYLCFRGKARRFNGLNPGIRFSNVISKKTFLDPCNGYVLDDNCVFGAEVFAVRSPWIIDRISLFDLKDPYEREWDVENEKRWSSEEFLVGGYKWKIDVRPIGNRLSHASIYLVCVDSKGFANHTKVEAKCLFWMWNNSSLNDNFHMRGTHWFTKSDRDLCLKDKHNTNGGLEFRTKVRVHVEVTQESFNSLELPAV